MKKIVTLTPPRKSTLDSMIDRATAAAVIELPPPKINIDPEEFFWVELTKDLKNGTYEGVERAPETGSISPGSGGRICEWQPVTEPHTFNENPDPQDPEKSHGLLGEIEGRPTGLGQTVKVYRIKQVVDSNGTEIYPERYVCVLNTDRCKVRVSGSGPDYNGTQLDGEMT